MKTKIRKPIALLLIGAILLGILPLTGHSVSRASGNGIRNPRTTDGVTTWDCVWFGNYWQGDTNGDGKADRSDNKQPIKWRVLSVDGDDAFLVADKNLDCQRYNDTDTGVTWETCTMRSWLNGYEVSANVCEKDYTEDNFMDNAFTSGEESVIKATNVVNEDNPEYKTEGGNSTQDKVYLLSVGEVTNPAYGFTTSYSEAAKSRRAQNSDYAKAQGAYTSTSTENAGSGYWWLRSPGLNSSNASGVGSNGDYVCGSGSDVNNNDYAVRPALHLNLSSTSAWSYAGTVSSEGGTDEQAPPAPEESPKPTVLLTPTAASTTTVLPTPTADSTAKPEASLIVSPAPMDIGNPRTTDGVTTWDCVWFGNYWQGDTNGDGKADRSDNKQPIKWRVLSVDGDDAFLVADKNLDCQRYNDTVTGVTWETCTMRSWLNGYEASANVCEKDYMADNFMDNAFTFGEQVAIRTMAVVNEDNSEYGTEGGNDTQDKVYLLSVGEVTNPAYGFTTSYSEAVKSRRAQNSDYAKAQGAYTSTSTENAGSGYWWLRSSGLNSYSVSLVYDGGNVYRDGDLVSSNDSAVRPALHLNLSSTSAWSYAGTVSSEGGADEQAPPAPEESPKPTVLLTPTAASTPTVQPTPTVAPTATVPSTPTSTPTATVPSTPISTPTTTVLPTPTVIPTTKPTVFPTVSPTMAPTPAVLPTTTADPTTQPTVSPVVSPVPIGPPKPTSAPPTSPTASEPPVVSGKPAAPSTGLPGVTPTATISGEKQQASDTETENLVSSPGKPVIKSVKNIKGRKIKIALKKEIKGAAGYQIQYARNKKFTKAKKIKDVGRWTSAKTIAGLKKGKKYYVRVRAYQNQSGKKVYGKWSKAKKVKIKK